MSIEIVRSTPNSVTISRPGEVLDKKVLLNELPDISKKTALFLESKGWNTNFPYNASISPERIQSINDIVKKAKKDIVFSFLPIVFLALAIAIPILNPHILVVLPCVVTLIASTQVMVKSLSRGIAIALLDMNFLRPYIYGKNIELETDKFKHSNNRGLVSLWNCFLYSILMPFYLLFGINKDANRIKKEIEEISGSAEKQFLNKYNYYTKNNHLIILKKASCKISNEFTAPYGRNLLDLRKSIFELYESAFKEELINNKLVNDHSEECRKLALLFDDELQAKVIVSIFYAPDKKPDQVSDKSYVKVDFSKDEGVVRSLTKKVKKEYSEWLEDAEKVLPYLELRKEIKSGSEYFEKLFERQEEVNFC